MNLFFVQNVKNNKFLVKNAWFFLLLFMHAIVLLLSCSTFFLICGLFVSFNNAFIFNSRSSIYIVL